MYTVYVQHYGLPSQVMNAFKRRADADRFMRQQAEIVKGYYKRTGYVGDTFVVFGDDDTFTTKYWVGRVK